MKPRIIFVFLFILSNLLTVGQSRISWVKAGKYAAVQDNERISEYTYTEVSDFREGYAWVNMGNWYGYINTQLDSITEFKYSVAESFANGFAIVAVDSSYGYINTMGEEICSLTYQRVLPFQMGLGTVFRDDKWNIIDASGVELLDTGSTYPPIILGANRIAVFGHNKWGVIDKAGNICYPFQFDYINKEGIAYKEGTKIYIGL